MLIYVDVFGESTSGSLTRHVNYAKVPWWAQWWHDDKFSKQSILWMRFVVSAICADSFVEDWQLTASVVVIYWIAIICMTFNLWIILTCSKNLKLHSIVQLSSYDVTVTCIFFKWNHLKLLNRSVNWRKWL